MSDEQQAIPTRALRFSPIVVTFVVALLLVAEARSEALAKLNTKKLEAVSQAIQARRKDWKAVPRSGPYREHRANLHVHSHWSHDSRGKIEEIVAAAKAVGTSVLMFNEHPADHYDFFKEGHQGIKDGVLMIPGAETEGFLAFPTMSLRGVKPGSPQEFSDLVRGRGGLMFVSHLEERMDWNVRGVTGVEIYNTHADIKDEKKLVAALLNPLWLLQASDLFHKYPQESYSALQDYPADYLKRWDELCLSAPHTGVSANDAHQNIGLVIRWSDEGTARVEDALGKLLLQPPLESLPNSEELTKGKRVGDVLYHLQLDPYEVALRHVGTHLLLTEHSENAVREALESGRAFVAFDWLANATGFDFAAIAATKRHEMGSQPPFSRGLTLHGEAPLPVHWRLLRNGKVLEESDGRTLRYPVAEAGNYRAEAWLDIAGERMIWVLSNPVYIASLPE
jgi:hypothetical protein